MKVCFLIDDFSAVGGIQRVLPIIASKLSEAIDVDVVSMYDINADNNANLYDHNVNLSTLINGPKLYIKQCLKVSLLLRKYIKTNNVNILISTSEMLSPYCILASVFTKTKMCIWTHCPAEMNSEAVLQGIFKWIGVKTADMTIALTPETENDLKRIYRTGNVTNIPNPIDPKLIKPVNYDSESRKIISVGRLSKQKNFTNLADVANIVLHNHSDWRWDIYGEGESREEIEQKIVDNRLSDSLHLMGNHSNVYDCYKQYSFLVMTSLYEGFPMVLLEAIANGLPIISYDIKTGPSLLIKNGDNGFLIQAYDKNEMAEAIEKLIQNAELRKKMSLSSTKRVFEFDVDTICDKWIELFNYLR